MERKARENNLRIVILTALMIALTFVAGSIIKIPTLNGFVQVGDCMVLLGAVLLGKKRGAISGAIGMALVDISAGYLFWAPFTFVIKGAMAYFTGTMLEKVKEKNYSKYIVVFVIGGVVNIFGYFIGNAIMGGIILKVVHGFLQSIIYALSYVIGDTIQSALGIIIALFLASSINKAKIKFNL